MAVLKAGTTAGGYEVLTTNSSISLSQIPDSNTIIPYAIQGSDTRAVNSNPEDYLSAGLLYKQKTSIQTEFKSCTAIGVNSILTGTYCFLSTYTPWSDSSGGYPIQMALGEGGEMAIRTGTGATTWGAWNNIWGSTNDGTGSGLDSDTCDGQHLGTSVSVQHASLGIGTAASGTAGEIRATNNVTAYYSDERLKDFHGTIPNALDKLMQLNGYYFTENQTAKELGYDNSRMQVGVSAQEVEKVLPEIVTNAPIDDNYKTVWYDKLTPLLIEAIKEQQKQIDELKAMVMQNGS